MNIEKHLKVAGVAYVVLGVIGFAVSSFLTIRDVYRLNQVGWENMGGPMATQAFTLFAVVLLSSCLHIFLGLGLFKQKRWATRVMGFIVAALTLFSFPIGTIIGGYTLWILIKIDKQEALMT